MSTNEAIRCAPSLLRSALLLWLSSGLAGCAHAPPTTQAPAPVEPVAEATPAPAPVAPAAAPAPSPVPVRADSIYFDFDRADIKPEGRDVLASFGGLLAKHPELHVRIEGNCDERGTDQYNIVLGARRAEVAKTYLLGMGAKGDQVSTVSYGKEHPRAAGHDEEAWRQNRRDDFVPDRESVMPAPIAVTP